MPDHLSLLICAQVVNVLFWVLNCSCLSVVLGFVGGLLFSFFFFSLSLYLSISLSPWRGEEEARFSPCYSGDIHEAPSFASSGSS